MINTESTIDLPPVTVVDPVIDKTELANLLRIPETWVATHAETIPCQFRLGRYLRFRRAPIEKWLGGLSRVLIPQETASIFRVPTTWIYSHADEIPGVLRLGYYIRFRRTVVEAFIGGSEACQ